MNRANWALDFDGVNDYVNTNSKFDIWKNQILWEAWINLDVNNIDNQIIHKRTSVVNAMFTLQVTTSGKLMMFTRNSGGTQVTATGATTITTGVWHHVIGNRLSDRVEVYLDGVLDGIAMGAAVDVDNGQNVIIGSAMGTTGFFNGRISRVQSWDPGGVTVQSIIDKRFTHLNPQENPYCGLIYAFDEGAGNTLYTASGWSNGTLNNFSGTYWVQGPPISGSGLILLD